MLNHVVKLMVPFTAGSGPALDVTLQVFTQGRRPFYLRRQLLGGKGSPVQNANRVLYYGLFLLDFSSSEFCIEISFDFLFSHMSS